MTVGIDRIAAPDSTTWDETWAGCDHATFFHCRHWLESWVRYSGGAVENASRLVHFSDGASAVVLLARRRRAGGLIASYESGPRGTYGGWLSAANLGVDHVRALVEHMTSLGTVSWYTNPFDPNIDLIREAGGAHDVTDAIALSDDFDAIFRSWSKGHRAAVKQAQRIGVTVRPASGIEDWRAYFGAYEDSVRRWGDATSQPYRWEMFELLSRLPDGLVRLWLAEYEGAVIAGAVCCHAPRHVVYWHGAAYEEHFKKRPVNLLMYATVRDACDRGLRWFDFNPSGGIEGVRAFKTSFGTTELPCPTFRRKGSLVRLIDGLLRK